MERIAQTVISGAEAGRSLLDFLSARFTYLSRAEWEAAAGGGIVTLNGKTSRAEGILRAGDVVRFSPESFEEPDVAAAYSVVYEDADTLVVDKPANLPVHPSGRFFKRTLWYLLRSERPGIRFATRLDRETSGLVLIAKTSQEARRLQKLQEGNRIDKRYLALVHGSFSALFPGSAEPWLRANGVLIPDPASAVRKKRSYVDRTDPLFPRAEAAGETCETLLALVEEGNGRSLLRAKLVTGRTHQIRATLCSLGFPLVGDKLYGVDERLFIRFAEGTLTDEDRERLMLPHQALHCESLVFPSTSGGEIRVSAPAPFSCR